MTWIHEAERGGERSFVDCGRSSARSFVLVAFFLSLALGARGALAQRTWVVDDMSAPGTDFTTLTAAYQAASPDDRILVRYGTGAGYAFPTPFDKPLRVLGDGAQRPVILYHDDPISCPGNELLIFHGLEFHTRRGGFSAAVEFSQGTVIFSRCLFPPVNSYPVNAYESKRMILIDCDITAPSIAVRAFASDIYLLNCRVSSAWSNGNEADGAVSNHWSPSIRDGGTLWIVGGTYRGGDAYIYCFGNNISPHSAVNANQGRAVIAGPAVLAGGIRVGPCGNGAHAAPFDSNCGLDMGGLIDPMVLPPNSWTCTSRFLSHQMPAVIAGPAARGQPQTLELWGPDQSAVALFASLLTPYDPIPLPIGDVWLDPRLTLHVGTGAVDAQRHLTLTTTIPSWLPAGEVLVYQAASLSSAGFELSAPGMAVVH